jgi:hypothetical protein
MKNSSKRVLKTEKKTTLLHKNPLNWYLEIREGMGLEDIVYDLIKEYHAAEKNEQRQIELAKMLATRAYLRFNFEWTTEREADKELFRLKEQQSILNYYSQLLLDVAVEIYSVLPDESERMQNIVVLMKKGAYRRRMTGTNEITPIGDECATKVLEYAQKIEE